MASSKGTPALKSTPVVPAAHSKVSSATPALAVQGNKKDEVRHSGPTVGIAPPSKVVPPVPSVSSISNIAQNKDKQASATTTTTSTTASTQDLAKFISGVPKTTHVPPVAATSAPLSALGLIDPKDSPVDSPIASRSSRDVSMEGDEDNSWDSFYIDSAPAPNNYGFKPSSANKNPVEPTTTSSGNDKSSAQQAPPQKDKEYTITTTVYVPGTTILISDTTNGIPNPPRVPRDPNEKRKFNRISFNPFPDPNSVFDRVLNEGSRNRGNPLGAPPVVPNGANLDAEDAEDLTDIMLTVIRHCLILSRVAHTVTPDSLNKKSYDSIEVVPEDVILNHAAYEAYIYYTHKEDWNKAADVAWVVGTVDRRNENDTTEDPNIRYVVYCSADSWSYPEMVERVGEAFQSQLNAVIMGVEGSKNPKVAGIQFASADDIRTLQDGKEGLKIVVRRNAVDSESHIINPIRALTFIKNDHRFVKLHFSGAPHRTSENKLLLRARAKAAMWGFEKEDVVILGIQRNKFTGAPTSYGFATVLGEDLARQFITFPLSVKGATITFSAAQDRPKPAAQ